MITWWRQLKALCFGVLASSSTTLPPVKDPGASETGPTLTTSSPGTTIHKETFFVEINRESSPQMSRSDMKLMLKTEFIIVFFYATETKNYLF
jgi:hypothetical protein